ncbi:hypothetical protein [Maritimibacter sp. UBA3975]|uniref:hypothetical protein n=1 Tax=Maritimibacter sp. UBA3975 TaxID=1946833 RepID=UPI000C09E0E3|nr:hypothetical protein [Maritimibacter sp. UBA3975]MAM62513.1 hypothetical protein [Maritimibacter sp.]|tara:strand:- start:5343 stop:6965 length:1623 start_codon:yes stop_codon:yes gene_type:complete
MGKINGRMLAGILVVIWAALGGAAVLKGGFFLGKHEGDTLHLLQMVLRMAEGDWPHLDFVTPIGVLAMAPIAWLVSLGMGVGHAILLSQVLVGLIALPGAWYVARTRFTGAAQPVFGALILILILALVHGETVQAVSISMHYNRWAWAAAFLAVATAVLPARGGTRTWDGVVIGAAMAVLLLTKATYLIAFLPPVLVALIGRKAWRSVWVGLATGLAIMAAVTVAAGTPVFWLAYLRDLATVAASDVRPQPGLPFNNVVGAPAYMAGSLALLLSVIWLRQAGRTLEGLVMLILVPSFFYVTYQNFGNDPQWLPLLGLMLIALVPEDEVRNGWGWEMGQAMRVTAVAVFAFGAPSVVNLAYSPFRHLTEDPEEYTALIPGSGQHEDIVTPTIRAHRVDAKVALDGPGTVYAPYWDEEFREGEVTDWRGETLPICTVEVGTVAWFQVIADGLVETGVTEGKTAFIADILNGFWLYGAFEPLPDNAPWYYGGLTGLANADYVVVPLCPLSLTVRHQILGELEEAGTALDEVARTEQFILYAVE